MKKKLATIMMAIVCVFAIGFCALACGSESEINGTYDMYTYSGDKGSIQYVLDDGDMTVKTNGVKAGEGTYEVSGKTVTLKSNGVSISGEIVSDGVIKFPTFYLCLDGKTPPAEESAE